MSGIEAKNYEKAVEIIKEQMLAMQNGDFSEEEMHQTKSVIRNQILEAIDTPRGWKCCIMVLFQIVRVRLKNGLQVLKV